MQVTTANILSRAKSSASVVLRQLKCYKRTGTGERVFSFEELEIFRREGGNIEEFFIPTSDSIKIKVEAESLKVKAQT